MKTDDSRAEDALWQLFEDTGDPMSWLIFRAADRKNTDERAGDEYKPQALG